MRGKWTPVLGILALVLVWAAVSSLLPKEGAWPSLGEVGRVLLARAKDGTLASGLLLSFKRLLTGYLLSVLLGGTVGVFMAASDTFRGLISPLVTGLQALPSVCWLPIGLLWFGLSDGAILFVIVLGSALSVAISVDAGCRNVPPLLVRAARTMGASGVVLYRRVVLPAALPEVLTGLRLAWAFAWRSLMAGELLFVTGGLGHLLEAGRELGDMAQVVGVMVVIVFVGLVSERLVFDRAQESLRRRWGLDRK